MGYCCVRGKDRLIGSLKAEVRGGDTTVEGEEREEKQEVR